MSQKEVIDTLSPVDSAWRGSSLNLPQAVDDSASGYFRGGGSVDGFFLLLSLMVLLYLACYLFRSFYRKEKTSKLLFWAAYLLGALSLPVMAVEFGFFPGLTTSYPLFLELELLSAGLVFLFIVLKSAVLYSISWVIRDDVFFSRTARFSQLFFLILVLVWIVLLALAQVFAISDATLSVTMVCILSSAVLLVRYLYLVRTLIAMKVPIIFSFLYLCTFEFLPLLVTVHLFILLQ